MVSILGWPGASVKRTAAVAVAPAGVYTEFLRIADPHAEGTPMGLTGMILAALALALVGAWLVRLSRS